MPNTTNNETIPPEREEPIMEECQGCGDVTPCGDIQETRDGEIVCEDCVEDCDGCGEHILRTELIGTEDGSGMCDECASPCNGCGSVFSNEDMHTITTSRWVRAVYESEENARRSIRTPGRRVYSEVQVCDTCSFECASCTSHFSGEDSQYRDTSGDPLCEQCYEEHYVACDRCDETVSREYVYSVNNGNEYACEACYDAYGDSGENGGAIHDYSYRPAVEFHATEKDRHASGYRARDGLYFGVEVEMEARGVGCDMQADAQGVTDGANGFLYVKEDGSIPCGFEVVSQPGTIAYWREHKLAHLSELAECGYRSYQTTTCGIHIHVSKRGMSALTQLKLLRFFRDNQDFVFRVSRRRRSEFNEWSPHDARSTTDASLTNKVRTGRNLGGRYAAVNVNNTATIEFRIFRGTLHTEAFRRNLEFLHAMIRYCEAATLSEPFDANGNKRAQREAREAKERNATTTWTLHAHRFVDWLDGDGRHVVGKNIARGLSTWLRPFAPKPLPDMEDGSDRSEP